ncbi:MAG TPA: phosphoribosylformylglycinamidine synthase subunit PurS [bacterium]|mgnify:CR=1 FL=1|nr:phosphoribosylformylglycinamidine synthase subunit PurS [bacterium]HOL66852.1 phosphoribosylformylglycinamidine synthase subunit PurS [bacterium]HPP11155.1 phosphoribosylformylglycinamidine synthase subunit PurS [bacterium]
MQKLIWLVEVFYRPEVTDGAAEAIRKAVEELGISVVEKVWTSSLYRLEGMLERTSIVRIARELLTDPISQKYRLGFPQRPGAWSVQVWYKPGVTDTVAETTQKAILDLGINTPVTVATGRCYFFQGKLRENILVSIARALLANELIEIFQVYQPSRGKKNGDQQSGKRN